jgi:hypothetical protein
MPAPDVTVTVSIPGGERLAEKTQNARLGIVGGLSILGTTSVVVPYSCSSWIHSIRRGIDVSRAADLSAFLTAHGMDRLIDATHLSAAEISREARLACYRAQMPGLLLLRPAWPAIRSITGSKSKALRPRSISSTVSGGALSSRSSPGRSHALSERPESGFSFGSSTAAPGSPVTLLRRGRRAQHLYP